MSKYQDFEGRPGVSKSSEKLECLKIPKDLKGKSVLDLGCNEGFFCIEAKKRGAGYVLGIDKDEKAIMAAKERSESLGYEIDFIHTDFFEIPDMEFDYIFFLSALHYVEDPVLLFEKIQGKLKTFGMLVLECGVSDLPGLTMERALRSIDERMFPSHELLSRVWLSKFTLRLIGKSVDQAGDPIPRKVFHCQRRKPNLMFVVGEGGIGKSVLASQIKDAPVISCDKLVSPVRAENRRYHHKAQKKFDEIKIKYNHSIRKAWDEAVHDPEIRLFFVELIVKTLKYCLPAPLVICEGYILNGIHKEVEDLLDSEFHCWVVTRGDIWGLTKFSRELSG